MTTDVLRVFLYLFLVPCIGACGMKFMGFVDSVEVKASVVVVGTWHVLGAFDMLIYVDYVFFTAFSLIIFLMYVNPDGVKCVPFFLSILLLTALRHYIVFMVALCLSLYGL